jgi:hypothetical protein
MIWIFLAGIACYATKHPILGTLCVIVAAYGAI